MTEALTLQLVDLNLERIVTWCARDFAAGAVLSQIHEDYEGNYLILETRITEFGDKEYIMHHSNRTKYDWLHS